MDVLSVIVGLGALFGGAGSVATVAYWREVRGVGRKADRHEEIQHHLAPLQSDVRSLQETVNQIPAQRAAEIRSVVVEALEPIKHSLTELTTKVEPLWQTLVQGAMHNADVLHHPDPERAELDGLIDHFKANTLTREEERLFRRYLYTIKNWEPGQNVGFPVYESEPSAAANLLSMLDLVRIYRERGRQ